MRKLYKTIKGRCKYWEAWQAHTKLVVHTGWLGHWGRSDKHAIAPGETEDEAIDRLAAPQVAAGYAPIAQADHRQLVIQRALDTWGTVEDLDTRDQIEHLANESLGWTGNGRSDGGDIGSGTINVFCWVVDPALAVKSLVIALRKAKLLADITIAYAPTPGAALKIGYPAGSRTRFSIEGKPKPKPRVSSPRRTTGRRASAARRARRPSPPTG